MVKTRNLQTNGGKCINAHAKRGLYHFPFVGILVPHHWIGNCPTLIFLTNSTAGQSRTKQILNFKKMKKKSLLLTAVAMLGLTTATMAQNVPSYVPTNGLVGWWPFNGNANDESGNGNNGTVNGATLSTDRFGNVGKAYSFDGLNDSISTSFVGVLGQNSRTIAFWAKTISTTEMCPIIYGSNNSGERFNATFNYASQGLTIGTGNSAITYNTPSSLNDNNWHHYTYVLQQFSLPSTQDFELFQDGILLNLPNHLYNITTLINTTIGYPVIFGGLTSSPGYPNIFFTGDLDDIGIWNRALDSTEIANLYNGNICYQTITVTDTLLINMGITGFNPVTYNNTIKIFPNPTSDHITIDYGNFASLSGYQLKIENSLGQQVFQTNINQQINYLSLTNWGGNGLYFVHIIDQQGNTIDIRKIVLQ
jgi:hypothetical protein